VTFSLVGRCSRTGAFGAVITSSSQAVAARCAYARAHVGAACSQNVTDPLLGPRLLDELARGRPADAALDAVVSGAPHVEYRQLSVVDATGRSATFTGDHALGRAASAQAEDCAAAGNLLASDDVPSAMVEAFAAEPDNELGDRLVAALAAGRDAGGEEDPVRSAGLLLVDDVGWPTTDLRVDWSEADPVADLAALWERWKPQARDYVTRALEPNKAPAFGVRGDE
jgi:uncharacterized Ntn-hydrolase superfamily protein